MLHLGHRRSSLCNGFSHDTSDRKLQGTGHDVHIMADKTEKQRLLKRIEHLKGNFLLSVHGN